MGIRKTLRFISRPVATALVLLLPVIGTRNAVEMLTEVLKVAGLEKILTLI